MRPEWLWQKVGPERLPLFLLLPHDLRGAARLICCHQEIAADSCFALGMLAHFAAAEREPWRYRDLFWECGMLGHVLSQRGRHAEATATMARARELNPLDSVTWAISAQVAFQARDVAGSAILARRAIVLDPQLWIGYMMLGQAHAAAGEPDLALEALADGERLANGNSKVVSLRGYVLARMGRTVAAQEVVAALTHPAPDRYVPPYAAALVYAGLGDRAATFAALERAYAARDVHLMYLPVDMKWDPYRTDPRFIDLLARCRFD